MSDMVQLADLTPRQLADIKAQGARGVQMTITYPFTTGLLLHGMARRIALEVVRRGFRIVDERHDGGKITRSHIIRFRGNSWDVVVFARALDEYLAQWASE